jgi:hypothetical protein
VANVVWQDVTALQANLSTVSEAAQMIILAHVNEDLNPDAFGGSDSAKYHLARVYLAAHLGELERRRGGASGQIVGKTIGTSAITINYAQASSGDTDALYQTAWGSQLALMIDSSPLRFVVSTCR